MSDIQKAAIGLVMGGSSLVFVSPVLSRGPFEAPTNVLFRRVLGGSLLTTSLGVMLFAIENGQKSQYKNEYRNALKTTGIIATGFGIGEMGVATLYLSGSAAMTSVILFTGGVLMIGLADDSSKLVNWSD
jgi:hypothetical protein